ncbi:MAG: hypothetical protein AAGF31_02250 [Planctomycetota bacterium]
MPTCFAVLATECLGSLDDVDADLKRGTAEQILGKQSPESGLFRDGDILQRDVSSHSSAYITMQHTYFALHALDALGVAPRYEVRFADRFLSVDYLRGWLDAGPWDNPWLHSNNFMFALTFLQHQHRVTEDSAWMDSFDAILDYLDERQDPETGLWRRDTGRDDRNAVFAAYHFFPYYFWRGRQPAYVERIIDTTLGTQTAEGFFLPDGGGACEDLDAVHTLVMMSMVSDHRQEDIRQCLERCLVATLASQKPDGGFCNYNPRRGGLLRQLLLATSADKRCLRRELVPRTWRYSGWRRLECPLGQSDMWSAWFRPLTLRVIADRYPDLYSGAPRGPLRQMPGLGWHDADGIVSAKPALQVG